MAKQRSSRNLTSNLLTAGILAGPFYLLTGFFQTLFRSGYDITRHDLSLLSNGELGWIQMANFLITGILVLLAAVGIKRVLKAGKGRVLAPLMLGLYGLGLIGAGIFVADPVNGFPPGSEQLITQHGIMHFVSGGIGFLGFITACFIFARRFEAMHERHWRVFSFLTGVLFFAAFIGIASGSQPGSSVLQLVTLAFWGAVILGFLWLSALCVHLKREAGLPTE